MNILCVCEISFCDSTICLIFLNILEMKSFRFMVIIYCSAKISNPEIFQINPVHWTLYLFQHFLKHYRTCIKVIKTYIFKFNKVVEIYRKNALCAVISYTYIQLQIYRFPSSYHNVTLYRFVLHHALFYLDRSKSLECSGHSFNNVIKCENA